MRLSADRGYLRFISEITEIGTKKRKEQGPKHWAAIALRCWRQERKVKIIVDRKRIKREWFPEAN